MTTKSTEAKDDKAVNEKSEHVEILSQAAADMYSSAHFGTDDVGVRLEKLEAYLKKINGKD
ncbi:hypothetical protein [Rahnella bonaserana]